jgi:hypothetical protein
VSTSYLTLSGDRIIYLSHLTLQITGSGFLPGTKVALSVVSPSPWVVLATGWTYAQDSGVTGWCDAQHTVCTQPLPHPGTFRYVMRFSPVPAGSRLLVLYRSGRHTGMHNVIL